VRPEHGGELDDHAREHDGCQPPRRPREQPPGHGEPDEHRRKTGSVGNSVVDERRMQEQPADRTEGGEQPEGRGFSRGSAGGGLPLASGPSGDSENGPDEQESRQREGEGTGHQTEVHRGEGVIPARDVRLVRGTVGGDIEEGGEEVNGDHRGSNVAEHGQRETRRLVVAAGHDRRWAAVEDVVNTEPPDKPGVPPSRQDSPNDGEDGDA